ncbi:hypothetical protein CMPELA_25710 [Cupriavidus necator]|uniref:Uncharacterized protein n=2 Tax=Cupriavidus necator (strain ATCC 17699 / DSM 428 / KCTC 22496 / NCIMB 10442 / H16 / Stanier 337) TaxID=381666 RepID=A0AAE5ZJU8_CUPNH|nr:hypothetical protein [Cupriavidus necator]QCC03974.1 hypothetical protein E6A55_25855 [Cupriavidus necator H16]QQB81033.1 hypothetical protein I6H87_25435 [Cupriavidus necator]WKA42868.1 hypothetical protein QWP09_25900 [Cupriavidus necator]
MTPAMGGAASAAMYSNPYTAAIMGASQVLTSTLGGPDGNKAAVSGGGMFDQHFDGSGWTVATGGSEARALPTLTSAVQATADNALSLLNNPMVLLAAAAVAIAFARRG